MSSKKQIDELLKKVLLMETQEAFDYLESVKADDEVINQVALLLKPSSTRTVFLQERGLMDAILRPKQREDLSGTTIQNIKLLKPLGEGGMGTVYLGEDTTLQRQVAIKALHNSYQINPKIQERFRREALILSQLDHPNICRIYNLIETEQSDYLVLELIKGRTLKQTHLQQLSRTRKFDIALALLEALKTAHSKNIIHRDLKPENIMINDQGEVKVLDFGISRLGESTRAEEATSTLSPEKTSQTVQGTVMGTLTYMSPEQAAGEDLTTASDIYTMGLIFQEIFSNTPVYADHLTADQLLKLSTAADTQIPTDLSQDLTQLIQRMKSKVPAERPTAVDAIQLLGKISNKPARRLKIGLIAALLLVATLGVYKHINDLNHERQQAQIAREQAEQVTEFLTSVFQVSNPYLQQAEEITAIDLLDQGAKRINTELQEQPQLQAYLKATIGDVYHVMGQMEQAKTLLNSAYTQIKQLPNIDKKTQSEVVIKYATLIMDLGEYEQSVKLIDEALQIIGDDQSEMALQAQNWLLLIHNRLNQYDHGIALAKKIINVYNAHPEYDIDILINAKNALGMMQRDTEQYQASEENLKSALSLINQKPTKESSTELSLMGNLASLYFYTDRLEQSLELRKQVVAMSEARLPENHPDLIDHYDNLAVDYYFMEDLEQAKFWNKKSLKVFENLISKKQNQPDNFIYSYSMTLANYGVLLTRDDEYKEAKSVFRDVVDNLTKILGEHHKTVADYVFEVARAEYKTGEIDAALTHANKAIDTYESLDVPYSSRELKSWLLKAEILYQQQKMEDFDDLKKTINQRLQSLDPPNKKFNQLAADTFATLTIEEIQH